MADPSLVDSLTSNPLVQLALLVATIVAGGVAGLRGFRQSASAAAEPNQVFPPEARFFFDGPIGRALDSLQGIYRNLTESRNEAQRAKDEIRGDLGEIIDLLRDSSSAGARRRRARRRRG